MKHCPDCHKSKYLLLTEKRVSTQDTNGQFQLGNQQNTKSVRCQNCSWVGKPDQLDNKVSVDYTLLHSILRTITKLQAELAEHQTSKIVSPPNPALTKLKEIIRTNQ